jgi:hypothetical protein
VPPAEEMRVAIERQAAFRRHVFRVLDDRRTHLVDYTTACDALAGEIGCKPTRAAVGRERRRFRYRLFAGPFVAAQYRLVGPHAKPEIARRVVEGLPVVHPAPMLVVYAMHLGLARLLRRRRGEAFAPKLELGR